MAFRAAQFRQPLEPDAFCATKRAGHRPRRSGRAGRRRRSDRDSLSPLGSYLKWLRYSPKYVCINRRNLDSYGALRTDETKGKLGGTVSPREEGEPIGNVVKGIKKLA